MIKLSSMLLSSSSSRLKHIHETIDPTYQPQWRRGPDVSTWYSAVELQQARRKVKF